MTSTIRTAVVLAVVLQGLAAAACENRVLMTGPTAERNDAGNRNDVSIPNSVSIAGVVYDATYQPLRGARVEVTEGTVGDWCHYAQPAPACVVAAITDGSGRFTFSGPFRSVAQLHASLEGYESATLTVDSTTSNTAIEFRLVPHVAP